MLPTAWGRVAAWRIKRPLRLRVPLPAPILQALFIQCLVQGFVSDPGRAGLWICMAVCLRIGFYGLLRPVELNDLVRASVAIPEDSILGFGARVVLSWSVKTSMPQDVHNSLPLRMSPQWPGHHGCCKGLKNHSVFSLHLNFADPFGSIW